MKKHTLVLCAVLMIAMIASSCESDASNEVTIGDQVWKVRNLNVDSFRNGDTIPEAKTDEEWIKARENGYPVWSYYDNNPYNGNHYGKLYNWYAVNDPRGICPEGWQMPSDAEWDQLINYLGGWEVAGGKLKETKINYLWGFGMAGGRYKFTKGWRYPNSGATNESGFSALPGGYRSFNGNFRGIGSLGSWWSSLEPNTSTALSRYLNSNNGNVTKGDSQRFGLSVRCLKD